MQELADRAAIVDTVIAYATAVDTRDWARLGALFTDDACWEYGASGDRASGDRASGDRASGDRLSGPDMIVARISASIERFDATHHLNGNHVTEVQGDEARHTCYYQAQHVRFGLSGGDKFLAGAATTTGCVAPPTAGGSPTAGSPASGRKETPR
jgi:hypothetical protein